MLAVNAAEEKKARAEKQKVVEEASDQSDASSGDEGVVIRKESRKNK